MFAKCFNLMQVCRSLLKDCKTRLSQVMCDHNRQRKAHAIVKGRLQVATWGGQGSYRGEIETQMSRLQNWRRSCRFLSNRRNLQTRRSSYMPTMRTIANIIDPSTCWFKYIRISIFMNTVHSRVSWPVFSHPWLAVRWSNSQKILTISLWFWHIS